MDAQSDAGALKRATAMSLGSAVVMIVLGLMAVVLPLATEIGVSLLVSLIIVFGGFAHLVYAFVARSAGAFIWGMLIGIVYAIGGIYLAFHLGLALAYLTLVVAAIFFFEGTTDIVVFFQFRSLPGSGWILFDGIVTLALGYFIERPWPSSLAWVIAILLGINLIFSGFTWLMCSVATRRELKLVA